jgi:RNA polymerase sigma-70 factor (ECF subfamily)
MTARVVPVSEPSAETERGPDLDQIYAQNIAFVWRCLRAWGISGQSLDDAAQDVFFVACRRYGEFRGDASLRTWLYAIVRNVALNYRRSDRRSRDRVQVDYRLSSAERGPLEQLQDREAAEFVQRFIDKLDDKKRDVFVLAVMEQMTIPEVAQTLGIPLNTAYTRFRSVRMDFHRHLEKYRGPL